MTIPALSQEQLDAITRRSSVQLYMQDGGSRVLLSESERDAWIERDRRQQERITKLEAALRRLHDYAHKLTPLSDFEGGPPTVLLNVLNLLAAPSGAAAAAAHERTSEGRALRDDGNSAAAAEDRTT